MGKPLVLKRRVHWDRLVPTMRGWLSLWRLLLPSNWGTGTLGLLALLAWAVYLWLVGELYRIYWLLVLPASDLYYKVAPPMERVELGTNTIRVGQFFPRHYAVEEINYYRLRNDPINAELICVRLEFKDPLRSGRFDIQKEYIKQVKDYFQSLSIYDEDAFEARSIDFNAENFDKEIRTRFPWLKID